MLGIQFELKQRSFGRWERIPHPFSGYSPLRLSTSLLRCSYKCRYLSLSIHQCKLLYLKVKYDNNKIVCDSDCCLLYLFLILSYRSIFQKEDQALIPLAVKQHQCHLNSQIHLTAWWPVPLRHEDIRSEVFPPTPIGESGNDANSKSI